MHTNTKTRTNSTLKSDPQVYSMSVFTRLHQAGLSRQQEELRGVTRGYTAPVDRMTPHTSTICVCLSVYLSSDSGEGVKMGWVMAIVRR